MYAHTHTRTGNHADRETGSEAGRWERRGVRGNARVGGDERGREQTAEADDERGREQTAEKDDA
jgi:hypothetical protein